jgi:hypothetical protein
MILFLSISIMDICNDTAYCAGKDSKDRSELKEILKGCAEYCEKVEKSAFFFVCRENIKEVIYQYPGGRGIGVVATRGTSSSKTGPVDSRVVRQYRTLSPPSVIKNDYIYDYQLIQRGQTIRENRTLLEENGKETNVKNASLKTKRFYSERSGLGPVGFLSRRWQDLYNYKIIKRQTSDGVRVVVIEAKPKEKIEGKPNFGKIWVDEEDFSVMKIEIEQESLAGFEELKKESEKSGLIPIITVTHDYDIKKNGLRFPSKTTFKEDLKRVGARVIKLSRLDITYDNYRFFTVEVEVKH